MHIATVASYKEAWETLNTIHVEEFFEIKQALDGHFSLRGSLSGSGSFSAALTLKGWRERNSEDGFLFRKGGVEVRLLRWGVDLIADVLEFIPVPNNQENPSIIVVPSILSERESSRESVSICIFEHARHSLQQFISLGGEIPVVIIGYSKNRMVFQLESLGASLKENKHAVDRSIEFPPEYHQAGLSILNYFSTYLREQYPEQKAKVRIEQDGLLVRLRVETEDGKTETVEKALHEYQMIVRGEASPEQFTSNPALIIGLKTKLEIAAVEIRMQQNLIGMQNETIDKLLAIVGNGLTNGSTIDVRPTINVTTNVTVNHVTHAVGAVNELKDFLGPSSELFAKLDELASSLETIENEKNPEAVKKSGAMSKFKRMIESFTEGTEETKKAIKAAEGGWEIVKDLAHKYNSIAEWCGLPQVPGVFIK
jgi:uncharacterized protein YggU (UPF0235/DUF167 family)